MWSVRNWPAAVWVIALSASSLSAGDLIPPDSPGSTPGPEPRTVVNEINTPGDADSMYRITESGSYYLAGNIASQAGVSAIEIAAQRVTLDLMGFEVRGDGTTPVSGIHLDFQAGADRVEVRNGIVTLWGGSGVDLVGFGNRASGLHVTQNGGNGVFMGDGGVVADCTVDFNTGWGISTGQAVQIRDCTLTANSAGGIDAGQVAQITNCTVYGSGGAGILANSGAVVRGCTIFNNSADGIHGRVMAVTDCHITLNSDDGIEVDDFSVIRGNLIVSNGGTGINATGQSNRVEDNTTAINSEEGIHATGTGSIFVRNSSGSNGMQDFGFASTETYGPIVTGGSGAITTEHPWANFQF